jgi:chloramphenicol-sensitive protein RarD
MAPKSSASAAASAISVPRSNATFASGGLTAAIAAFVIWGLFPLYLMGLKSVPAVQIIAHRIVWSCVFILGWMAARGQLSQLREAVMRDGVLVRLTGSALFISANWIAFVWAINNDRVIDVSLGYYINPLFNVLLGIFVLSERLNRTQWAAVGFAAAGVLYLTFATGHVPWVALTVAISFALYGLIRKTVSVEALPGLAIETLLLVPFAAAYLLWSEVHGVGAFGHASGRIDTLLLLSGLITAVPLFLFAYGARRIPYSTMGVLQFIAPSLQLASGIFVFGETFEHSRAVGFLLIWIALAIYAGHGLWQARSLRTAAVTS